MQLAKNIYYLALPWRVAFRQYRAQHKHTIQSNNMQNSY